MSSAICFNLDQSKILLSDYGLSLYQTMTILRRNLLETPGDQHFLLFQECFPRFSTQISIFEPVVIVLNAKTMNLDKSRILSFGKELTLSQMLNFRLFQTERVCRRQFQFL